MSVSNRPMRNGTPGPYNGHNGVRRIRRNINTGVDRGRTSSKGRRWYNTHFTRRVRQRQAVSVLNGPRRLGYRPRITRARGSRRPPKSSTNSTRDRGQTRGRRTVNCQIGGLPSFTSLIRSTHSSTVRSIEDKKSNSGHRHHGRLVPESRHKSR